MKDIVLAFLANAIYTETITERQALNSLAAMDAASSGTDKELDQRAKAVTPIVESLTAAYMKEANHDN